MSDARRRAEMFVDEVADPRGAGPTTGDERVLLQTVLADQRATLELKCSGLGDADLALRAVEPSTLSLVGLVRHLADMERRWFRQVLAGADVALRYGSEEDPDGDFDGARPEVVGEAWEAWRDEVAFAEAFVRDAPGLEVQGYDGWRGTVSLRWVLVHMIEEYARHNGHADLLRERIDGAVGL
ncbi:MAG: DinB family protein [Saccharothrix sp.]|nr:DinB family protein [Saccharothrix sp.]